MSCSSNINCVIFTSDQLSVIQRMIDCCLEKQSCHQKDELSCLKKEVCDLKTKVCHLEEKVDKLELRVISNANKTIQKFCEIEKEIKCLVIPCPPKPDCRIDELIREVDHVKCEITELQKADHAYVLKFKEIDHKLCEINEKICKLTQLEGLSADALCKMKREIDQLRCLVNKLTPCQCNQSCPQPCERESPCNSPTPCIEPCYQSPIHSPCVPRCVLEERCDSPPRCPLPCQERCSSPPRCPSPPKCESPPKRCGRGGIDRLF